jgi:hypothetical protein
MILKRIDEPGKATDRRQGKENPEAVRQEEANR